MAEAKAEGKVPVLNRGRRTFHLADGKLLKPGQGCEVSAEEAKGLLEYKDLVDARKVVKLPSTSKIEAENAELKKQNDELKAQLEDKGKGKK